MPKLMILLKKRKYQKNKKNNHQSNSILFKSGMNINKKYATTLSVENQKSERLLNKKTLFRGVIFRHKYN